MPDLEHRAFIPTTSKAADKPLNLLIDMHGTH